MLCGQADRLENNTANNMGSHQSHSVTLHFVSIISDFSPTARGYTKDQGNGPEDLFQYSVLHLQ